VLLSAFKTVQQTSSSRCRTAGRFWRVTYPSLQTCWKTHFIQLSLSRSNYSVPTSNL